MSTPDDEAETIGELKLQRDKAVKTAMKLQLDLYRCNEELTRAKSSASANTELASRLNTENTELRVKIKSLEDTIHDVTDRNRVTLLVMASHIATGFIGLGVTDPVSTRARQLIAQESIALAREILAELKLDKKEG